MKKHTFKTYDLQSIHQTQIRSLGFNSRGNERLEVCAQDENRPYDFICEILISDDEDEKATLKAYPKTYGDISSREIVKFLQDQLPEVLENLEGVQIGHVEITLVSLF